MARFTLIRLRRDERKPRIVRPVRRKGLLVLPVEGGELDTEALDREIREERERENAPEDAARMLRAFRRKVPAADLDQEQTLRTLEDAQSRGVTGRMVHDWMHARAAKLAGVDLVLTRDEPLSRLYAAEGLATEWP